MCRWKSRPMSPTTPRRRSRSPGGCTTRPTSPTCWSRSRYAAEAYLRALGRRGRVGLDLAVPSVASLFISRWDSAADPLLPPALPGSLGCGDGAETYASHVQLLSDQRWQALAKAGARPQRVLWASTSTKNPDLPDTYYLAISADWLPRPRSTPSRRRRCSPSLTTEASMTGWSPTTQPGNGPLQRPPTLTSTPMPSLSISNATEQAHSPRTGPRCSRRSKKRQRSLHNTPEAKIDEGSS
jgi:hypothetical protein